jgi:hypothetical protein
MNSQDSHQIFYDPKTLAMMDRAFAAIWTVVKAETPFAITPTRGEASEPGGGWDHRSYSAATAHR